MKNLINLIFLFALFSCSHQATVNKVELSGEAHKISDIFAGVNGNLVVFDKPWDNQMLLKSFQKMEVPALRYPGGTIGNYWDWEKGGIDESVPEDQMIKWVVEQGLQTSPNRYNLENLAKITKTGITPVFMLNMLSKGLDHSLKSLRTADSLGIPVKYIELGNELYFNLPFESRVYPTPEDYGHTCKEWIIEIKKEFPGAKFAVLASNRNAKPRDTNWTQRVLSTCDNADAMIFHMYSPNGIDGQKEKNNVTAGEEGLSDKRIGPTEISERQKWELELLKDPYAYGNMIGMAYKTASKVKKLNVPENMEIWVTEFNIRDDYGALRGTWANTMALAMWYKVFLDHPQVTLTNYHNLTGDLFPAIYNESNGLSHIQYDQLQSEPWTYTAGGTLLHIIAKTINRATEIENLRFSSNIQLKNDLGESFDGIDGWIFRGNNSESGMLFNLSNSPMEINLSGITSKYTAQQYVSNLNNYIMGTKSLEIVEFKDKKIIKLAPFSITCFDFS
jgi:hypothetical protein